MRMIVKTVMTVIIRGGRQALHLEAFTLTHHPGFLRMTVMKVMKVMTVMTLITVMTVTTKMIVMMVIMRNEQCNAS